MAKTTITPAEILPNESFEVPGLMGQFRMVREVHREGDVARFLVKSLPSGNPFHMVLADWRKVDVMR